MAQLESNKKINNNEVIDGKKAIGLIAGIVLGVIVVGMAIGYIFFWDKPAYSSPEDYRFVTAYNNVKKYPKDADMRLQLGWEYLQKGDTENALVEYNNALKINPNHLGAKLNIALVYSEQKDYKKAKVELEKLIKKNPTFVDAKLALGNVYYHLKDYGKAREQFEFALNTNPGTVDYIFMIGKIYEAEGKKSEAKKQYEQALSYVPNYQPAVEALKQLGVKVKTENKGGERP